jgi:flagellar hook-basal body complex protein FliE
MDENTINDINKKFENLTKKCELLEKKNKVNENAILNLNTQLKFLREEHKKEVDNIKLNFTIQLKNFFNTISQNKAKGKECAEIIIVDQNNGIEDIKNMCIEMINKIEKKLIL